jgi:hypothetical protein
MAVVAAQQAAADAAAKARALISKAEKATVVAADVIDSEDQGSGLSASEGVARIDGKLPVEGQAGAWAIREDSRLGGSCQWLGIRLGRQLQSQASRRVKRRRGKNGKGAAKTSEPEDVVYGDNVVPPLPNPEAEPELEAEIEALAKKPKKSKA